MLAADGIARWIVFGRPKAAVDSIGPECVIYGVSLSNHSLQRVVGRFLH